MNVRILGSIVLASLCMACGSAQPCMVQVPSAASPKAQDDGLDALSTTDLAKKMLADANTKDMGMRIMDAMSAKFRSMSDLPPGFVDRFVANARASMPSLDDQFVEILVKAYDRETLLAAVRFYESSAGRKVMAGMPAIMEQSMALGDAWGRELAAKTVQELQSAAPAK
jgi:hypothetical protein